MRLYIALAAAATLMCAPIARAQHTTPPPDLPAHPYRLPNVIRETLPNGLLVIIAESRGVPLVTMRLGVRAGTALDPPDQPGLAAAVADQMSAGTDRYTSLQLKQAGERLGGDVNVSAEPDYATVSASALAANTGTLASLMADVLTHPSFPSLELEIYKGLTLQGLTFRRQDPSFLASEQIARALYGSHPYSVVAPTPESIRSLTRQKLLDFYQSHYGPTGAVLVVVGAVRPAEALLIIRKTFGAWHGSTAPQAPVPQPTNRARRQVLLLDRPGSVQSDIEIGNIAIKRGDPDFEALLVANTILGGDVGSRLFINVRERLGYAYDVHSTLTARALAGDLIETAQTRTAVTAPAIKEMLDEEDAMRDEPVAEKELAEARAFVGGTFILRLTTQSGLADRLLTAALNDLPVDYLETFRMKVDAVTAEDVQRVARNYMRTDQAAVVVVGDATKVRDSLKPFGEVQDVH